jgi:hypothetical protein
MSLAGTLHAQELTVTGRVISAQDSIPRGGVSVVIKGTRTGVLTTTAGNYSIHLPSPSDTLIFTFLGFETEEHPVGSSSVLIDGQTVLNVDLEPATLALDMGIVVQGYGVEPGAYGRRSDCTRTFSPMPGSAYDPNWQRDNPELAGLMLPNCSVTVMPPRRLPQTPPAD